MPSRDERIYADLALLRAPGRAAYLEPLWWLYLPCVLDPGTLLFFAAPCLIGAAFGVWPLGLALGVLGVWWRGGAIQTAVVLAFHREAEHSPVRAELIRRLRWARAHWLVKGEGAR